jgi:predicted dehydrogenase
VVKIAIVGTGNISRMHIEAFKLFPERCEITALVDIYPEKAQQRKELFELTSAKVYNSHKDILDNTDIDLVSICTPPYCHAEITIDFLNHGKNVLLEKPMAASLEECDAIIEAEKSSGRLLSVIAQNRFRDPMISLKKILDSGLIGKVVHAQVDSLWWRGHCYYDLWWRGLWEKEGGGCTLNHAVHHIDLLNWMMGTPLSVSAVLSNVNHNNSEVEDISVAIMQYGGGALAQVTSSVVHHGEEQQLIFQGEHARVSAPWRVYASLSENNGFPKPERNTKLEDKLTSMNNSNEPLKYIAHDGQIEDVLTALEQDRTPMISGQDGRKAIETISAIYKAGSTKQQVELPIQKDDPFYTVEGIMANTPRFFKKNTSAVELGSGDITVGNDYTAAYDKKR